MSEELVRKKPELETMSYDALITLSHNHAFPFEQFILSYATQKSSTQLSEYIVCLVEHARTFLA